MIEVGKIKNKENDHNLVVSSGTVTIESNQITRKQALNTEKIGENDPQFVEWFDKDNYEKLINEIFDYVEKLEKENEILKAKQDV